MKKLLDTPYIDNTTAPDNIHKLYRFDNDYGASVLRTDFSRGSEYGLYELEVIVWFEEDFYLKAYDIVANDEPLGFLTEEEVEEYLHLIKKVAPAKEYWGLEDETNNI